MAAQLVIVEEGFEAVDHTPCQSAPDLWFSESTDMMMETAVICNTRCLVKDRCLAEAMEFEAGLPTWRRHGVWGGLTPGQRTQLARASRAPTIERTGTYV